MNSQTTMTYSPTADAFALSFNPTPSGQRLTREVLPNIRLDYVGDVVVGIEIFNASAVVPSKALESIGAPAVVMLSLSEAGREFKRHPRTLRHAAERGKIEGALKVGRDWSVPRLGVLNYIANLPPAGRPPKNRRAPNRKRGALRGSDVRVGSSLQAVKFDSGVVAGYVATAAVRTVKKKKKG